MGEAPSPPIQPLPRAGSEVPHFPLTGAQAPESPRGLGGNQRIPRDWTLSSQLTDLGRWRSMKMWEFVLSASRVLRT